jgi:hypothetical protein
MFTAGYKNAAVCACRSQRGGTNRRLACFNAVDMLAKNFWVAAGISNPLLANDEE